jgi:uncharacterized membrane protein/protein-disulfide isomerase
MSPRVRWAILIVALLGLGVAAESAWVHYRLLTDASYVSPCDINAKFNCSTVYLSRFGTVWGVPVALGGLIWFALVALVAAFARPSPASRSSVAAGYLFALSTIGLGVILYLAYASFFVLHTGCVLCMTTYACVITIFILSSLTPSESIARLPARLVTDLRGIMARPATLMVATLYLAAAASVVAFFPREGALAEQAASAPAPSSDAKQAFRDVWAKQPRTDLGIPADGAKVIIVKFNDYECPACRQAEELYQPVLDKFAKSNPGAVKYVMKDWPWNSDCNFNTTSIPGHEAACYAAAAARMARDRGKYDEMAAWLFANQETKPENVQQAAERILGITDFQQEYALKLPDIRRDVADGGVLRINSTPTYFVNGVRLTSLIPAQYLELAINIEMEKSQ